MLLGCCFLPAVIVGLLLTWVGCLISAERQGGSRALTITGWTAFGLAVAVVVVPATFALFVWIRSLF